MRAHGVGVSALTTQSLRAQVLVDGLAPARTTVRSTRGKHHCSTTMHVDPGSGANGDHDLDLSSCGTVPRGHHIPEPCSDAGRVVRRTERTNVRREDHMADSWLDSITKRFENTFHPAHMVAGVCDSYSVSQVSDLLS